MAHGHVGGQRCNSQDDGLPRRRRASRGGIRPCIRPTPLPKTRKSQHALTKDPEISATRPCPYMRNVSVVQRCSLACWPSQPSRGTVFHTIFAEGFPPPISRCALTFIVLMLDLVPTQVSGTDMVYQLLQNIAPAQSGGSQGAHAATGTEESGIVASAESESSTSAGTILRHVALERSPISAVDRSVTKGDV